MMQICLQHWKPRQEISGSTFTNCLLKKHTPVYSKYQIGRKFLPLWTVIYIYIYENISVIHRSLIMQMNTDKIIVSLYLC